MADPKILQILGAFRTLRVRIYLKALMRDIDATFHSIALEGNDLNRINLAEGVFMIYALGRWCLVSINEGIYLLSSKQDSLLIRLPLCKNMG